MEQIEENRCPCQFWTRTFLTAGSDQEKNATVAGYYKDEECINERGLIASFIF